VFNCSLLSILFNYSSLLVAQLFAITCHSSMVLLPIPLIVVHCSSDYSSVKCVHCCYFLVWLLATEALWFLFMVQVLWLLLAMHLLTILEKLEPEVMLKS
jgi:hypothetical protein